MDNTQPICRTCGCNLSSDYHMVFCIDYSDYTENPPNDRAYEHDTLGLVMATNLLLSECKHQLQEAANEFSRHPSPSTLQRLQNCAADVLEYNDETDLAFLNWDC